jgi:hypothetical protein
MGDLPGSPSVAPSPLFGTAPWGEGAVASLAAAPTLPDGAEPDCMGVRGLPRGPGGDRSVVNTAARGREEPRRCLHRSTQHRRWPRNLRLFVRLLPFFLFLFPPMFFCFRLRGVAPGAQVAESDADPRSGTVIPLRAAPSRRGEQMLGRSVSDRAFLVAAVPSPMAR